NWLNEFANMESLGISSSELWELRNSLLHMTNLDSRKVIKGDITRLAFFVGTLPEDTPTETDGLKYFNLRDLIREVLYALEHCINTLNSDPSKMTDFIQRYDLVVSDVRKSFHGKEV